MTDGLKSIRPGIVFSLLTFVLCFAESMDVMTPSIAFRSFGYRRSTSSFPLLNE
jgi:hypothetical protein